MKASAKPNWPAPSEACSWIQGTRVAKDLVTAPCTANTAATAYRARLTSSRADVTSLMFLSPPRACPAPAPRHRAVNYQGSLPDR